MMALMPCDTLACLTGIHYNGLCKHAAVNYNPTQKSRSQLDSTYPLFHSFFAECFDDDISIFLIWCVNMLSQDLNFFFFTATSTHR